MVVQDYYLAAREHERVFMNILRDLKKNKMELPLGSYVPADLETELELEEFFSLYSEGLRQGFFTITNFTRDEKKAVIGFENVSFLAGGAAELEYLVKEDDTVEYVKPVFRRRF